MKISSQKYFFIQICPWKISHHLVFNSITFAVPFCHQGAFVALPKIFNQFLMFQRSKNPFDDQNFKLKIFLFKFFHLKPAHGKLPIQQYHLCSAFSSSYRLCSTTIIFLNDFSCFKDQNPFDNDNFKLEIGLFKFFYTNLSMANGPPLCVQQYHLCRAFSSSRSLCSTSKIFLIDSSCFKD